MSDHPSPDITPVVRADVRRLTYAELAAVRGISRASAERLVRRKRWPRQVGNDGVVRVTISPDETAPDKTGNGADRHPGHPPPDIIPDSSDSATPAIPDIMGVIREVVRPLTAQLERERERIDRAERKIDKLEVALADARAAEQIAADEAAALRAQIDLQRARPWWRRWSR